MMYYIREINDSVDVLQEGEGDKKNLYIEGIYLQSNLKNKNGRLYPEHVMDKEVNRYINEEINANKAVGELGHPDVPQTDPSRVSHKITSLIKEGTNWRGRARVANTTKGNDLRGLIETGIKVGVSSRALGSLKKVNGIMEVQDDFRLFSAADVVLDPSAPDAFVNGIMEGVAFWFEDGNLKSKKTQIAEVSASEIEVVARSRKLNERTALDLFQKYLKRVDNALIS